MKDEEQERQVSEEAQAYAKNLLGAAANQRLPELFSARHPGAIYYLPNRNGISLVVLRSTDLSEDQLIKLLKYRLAQYIAVGFVDAQMVYEAQMEHEPLDKVALGDVHYIAGSPETGEILCYMVLRDAPYAPTGTTLKT
jgi:hypothetical protein